MSLLMQCLNIKKQYGEFNILNGVSFNINTGDKLGLVGINGAGKTTLANILSRNISCDEGSLIYHKQAMCLSYLKQTSDYDEDSLGEFRSDRRQQKAEFYKACDELNVSYLVNGKNSCHWDKLSGGEKIKLLLAKVITSKSDFLILDEPTNHLDLSGITWLIDKLSKYKGTVLVISHDRYFLDAVATKIVELDNGKAHMYQGNYSFYRDEKKKAYDSQLNAYLLQENYKNKIDSEINNLKNWSYKAHKESAAKAIAMGNKMGGKEHLRTKAKKMDNQIKSRIKRLEKIDIEGVTKPKEEKNINFSLMDSHKVTKSILSVVDLSKSYGSNIVFHKSTFYINREEKVGIYGINGCGKTTLLKILLNKETYEGKLSISKGINIGYISQDVLDLPEDKTILEYLDPKNNDEMGTIISNLYNLGFDSAAVSKKLFQLSMGEKMKIKLTMMIKNNNDVLILDEPTNHMDLHFREQLETVLENFTGTLLLVTHDRYMLERICNKLLVFEHKAIKKVDSGFKEYISRPQIKEKQEDKLTLINNELTFVISKLSTCKKDSEEYKELDTKYTELIKMKRKLSSNFT
ncbi:ribosomal protection-like ABC-F family protein [Clostridium oryzae]|uniref:Putative ABC transporter ATP-binding protein YheS n=1 Tax=Clostridium oryzae TaxID=1450648 RepID=A0A1V4IKY7_9CLOT|nr:ABC-F type ribosomal protection protein [Clostridium oryzae]OPJ60500.1 putative ABC transporter ATP-binding protein YheS [Clostridium oryzae]